MKRARQSSALAAILVACGGAGAQGQAGAEPSIGRVAPNIYEVAPEQLLRVQEAPAFIEVSGRGTAEVPADRAEISFAMETRASDAGTAAGQNADQMSRVLAALRNAGFGGLELETFGYSLQPQYATDAQRVRTIVAYVAYNNVRATIERVEEAGRLIDVAVAAGANRVASIAFSASDTEPARARALAEAVRNARAQARVIANSLGYDLGPPLEVRGGAERPVPIMLEAMRTVQAQTAPTPIEAGSQTVDANVTIRFALGREVGAR
ncbi:MAG TPA: SIMPL domain-containing protein [Longimicrobiales bacterium]|nr:SIMPL domain-containing protein [Longimicrobiales bacterium]